MARRLEDRLQIDQSAWWPLDQDAEDAGASEVPAELARLDRRHRRLVWPLTGCYLGYYLLLIVLAGYAPGLMQTRIAGELTVAYVFALSQFPMVGVAAFAYMRLARSKVDPLVERVREQLQESAAREASR
jgi:uncharacterized membrane protein (DUF485 family)